MWPSTITELAAFVTAVAPIIIASFAGLRASRTKALENDLLRWKRLNELAMTLYNKDHGSGLLAQLAAAHELGEMSRPHKEAARTIIAAARVHFVSNLQLSEALALAMKRSKSWW